MNQTATIRQPAAPATNDVALSFVNCLTASNHVSDPFDYWLLDNVLPPGDAAAIADLPYAAPDISDFNGRRESHNSTRVYFTPETQSKHDICRRIVDGFQHAQVIAAIEQRTGADLSATHLRIEYCQDTEGFWLEPHTDIAVKKFTMLVYLSDDPGLSGAGTDIHQGPPNFEYVTSAPYARNKGVIFIPGSNSWHGVGKRPFKGVRKAIIINYVAASWRETWQLA